MASVVYSATGKRKTSVARVRLAPGTGVITVNGKDLKSISTARPLYSWCVHRWWRPALIRVTTWSPTYTVGASPAKPVL